MTPDSRHILCGLAACACLWAGGCSSGASVAGGGEIGNPSGRLSAVVVDGTGSAPVAGALARVRPAGYLAPVIQPSPAKYAAFAGEVETGADGSLRVDSLEPGDYTLEIIASEGLGALYRFTMPTDTGHDAGTIAALPLAAVEGGVPQGEFDGPVAAQIFGLERIVHADSRGRFAFTSLPAGDYRIRLVSVADAGTVIDVDGVTATPGETVSVSAWDGWKFEASLVVRPAALGLSGPVAGFPLLVRLAAPDFDLESCLDGGADLRFVGSDTGMSALPYEIEQWDRAAGQAAVWVRLDTLYHTTDSQVVRMYWGNQSAVSRSSGRLVFDTAAGYQAVWHLADENSVSDAAGVVSAGTNSGASPVDAVCGAGLRFTRADSDYVRLPAAELAVRTASGAVSFWVRSAFDFSAHEGILFYASKDLKGEGFGQDYEMHVNFDIQNRLQFVISDTSAMTQSLVSPGALNDGRWHHVAAQWQLGGTIELYVDGARVDGKAHGGSDQLMAGYAALGRPYTITDQHFRYADADIDEVRLHGGPVSVDVVKCMYENQRPGSAFLTLVPVR